MFKIAAVIVVLMTAVLFGVIFGVILFGMQGWIAACYGILYCFGTGFLAKMFIVPKIIHDAEEKEEDDE